MKKDAYRNDYFWDIDLLRGRIVMSYDIMFDGPPDLLVDDGLDGDAVMRLSGVKYIDAVGMIGVELDDVAIFDLIEEGGCRYYLGSYLIDCLDQVELSRVYYPVDHNPRILGVGFLSMLSFLQKEDTISWICSIRPLAFIVVEVLDLVVNNSAFFLSDETLSRIGSCRSKISKGC